MNLKLTYAALIAAAVLALLRWDTLTASAWHNIGSSLFVKALTAQVDYTDELESATALLLRASNVDRSRRASLRQLGLALAAQNHEDDLSDLWRASDYSSDDLVLMGNSQPDSMSALRWYRWATDADEDNEYAWLIAGKACQDIGFDSHSFCQSVLDRTGGNLLVDAQFSQGLKLWNQAPRDGEVPGISFEAVACPERRQQVCGSFLSKNPPVERNIYIHQCLRLSPGHRYRFGAWIKVEKPEGDGKWLPVYYQGKLDGAFKGKTAGAQYGSSDWQYWTQDYVMPNYEDDRLCVFPVRFDKGVKSGQAWFHGASLTKID